MTQKQEGYLSPLDRLQQDAVSAAASPSEWLDQHREDVLAVWKDKGTTAIAAILGLTTSTLRGWAKRRKLEDGLVAKRTRRKSASPVRKGPGPGGLPAAKRLKPADPHGAGYWRGQAEAYKHALELVCGLMHPVLR